MGGAPLGPPRPPEQPLCPQERRGPGTCNRRGAPPGQPRPRPHRGPCSVPSGPRRSLRARTERTRRGGAGPGPERLRPGPGWPSGAPAAAAARRAGSTVPSPPLRSVGERAWFEAGGSEEGQAVRAEGRIPTWPVGSSAFRRASSLDGATRWWRWMRSLSTCRCTFSFLGEATVALWGAQSHTPHLPGGATTRPEPCRMQAEGGHLGEAVRRKPSKRLLQKSSSANSSANSARFPMSRCRKMSPNARSPKVSTADTAGVSPARHAAPASGCEDGGGRRVARPPGTGCPVSLQAGTGACTARRKGRGRLWIKGTGGEREAERSRN